MNFANRTSLLCLVIFASSAAASDYGQDTQVFLECELPTSSGIKTQRTLALNEAEGTVTTTYEGDVNTYKAKFAADSVEYGSELVHYRIDRLTLKFVRTWQTNPPSKDEGSCKRFTKKRAF